MKGDEFISRYLASQGVERVYEVIGGMIARIVDAAGLIGEPRIVDCHHEQAAAFAAEGEGRLTGVPGVAMGTSGPGAINLLTGLGSCHFDSTPAVFITGQVNRAEQKGTRAIRQLGFQETDIVAMAEPIAKAAWRVTEPEELPRLLGEAFLLARSGRPGPVLLDVPMDIQGAEIDAEIPSGPIPLLVPEPSFDGLGEILRDLADAERPLILAGGGVNAGRARDEVRRFAEAVGVPVVHSLMAVDVLPYRHPLRVGMIGTYGNRWANIALGSCDALLVLGSRLDIRQTGADVDAFKAGRTIHHVDVDPGELNNRVTGVCAVTGELSAFLAAAAEIAPSVAAGDHSGWIEAIAESRRTWPDTAELREIEGINPNVVMHELSARAPVAPAAYAVDVGQHQMWAAQSLELDGGTRFLTSGGMGAMGSALPMALGAALAGGGRPVVMVAGDGAFQLNLQELETVRRNALPIKLVVLNNRCHGMVRQFQETYFDERYQSTLWGYSTPDFARVAQAYGLSAAAVSEPGDLVAAVERLWADPDEPYLLEVAIDTMANAYPKIAFGHPITEMEPFAKPVGLEST